MRPPQLLEPGAHKRKQTRELQGPQHSVVPFTTVMRGRPFLASSSRFPSFIQTHVHV